MAAHSIPAGVLNNYFSLDDILASQEKIPCTFNVKVASLGYLDQSTTDPDINEGTKLELPLWLAKYLYRGTRGIVSVDTPKTYRQGYRHIFTADPNVVDLHRLGPYFYLFGGKLLSLQLPDSEDIADVLLKASCPQRVLLTKEQMKVSHILSQDIPHPQYLLLTGKYVTFQGRFRRIMDGSQNALHMDLTSQISMLDQQERQLFAAGQRGLYDFQKWESRESEKLSTSVMVANHRKRKRICYNTESK